MSCPNCKPTDVARMALWMEGGGDHMDELRALVEKEGFMCKFIAGNGNMLTIEGSYESLAKFTPPDYVGKAQICAAPEQPSMDCILL